MKVYILSLISTGIFSPPPLKSCVGVEEKGAGGVKRMIAYIVYIDTPPPFFRFRSLSLSLSLVITYIYYYYYYEEH